MCIIQIILAIFFLALMNSLMVFLFLRSAQLVNYQVAKSIYLFSNQIDVLVRKLIRI